MADDQRIVILFWTYKATQRKYLKKLLEKFTNGFFKMILVLSWKELYISVRGVLI